MDSTSVTTMIESGHASAAHLAKHFKVSVSDILAFMRENDIRPPTASDPQFRHISKLATAQRQKVVPWEDLVFDDDRRRYVNGIDTETTTGNINAKDILLYYQGGDQLRCFYTNEPVDSVLTIDANRQNFLVSNLVAMSPEASKERGYEEVLPILISSKQYAFAASSQHGVGITIHLHGRFDPQYGAVLNDTYLDAVVDQWVDPYLSHFELGDLLPADVPATSESISLWLWRHLSTVAMLKGVARLDVEYKGVSSFVTKDSYLQMVMGLLQRAVQSRAIARPSGLVLPTGADVSALNKRS